jgi:hypothetical protein
MNVKHTKEVLLRPLLFAYRLALNNVGTIKDATGFICL